MKDIREFDPLQDIPPDFLVIMYGIRRSGKTTLLMHLLEKMHPRLAHMKAFLISGSAFIDREQYGNIFPPHAIKDDIEHLDSILGQILSDHLEELQEYHQSKGNSTSKRKKVGAESVPSITGNYANTKIAGTTGQRGVRGRVRETLHQTRRQMFEEEQQESTEFTFNNKRKQTEQEHKRGGSDSDDGAPELLIILDDVVNENSIRSSKNLKSIAVTGRHFKCNVIILSQGVSGSQSVPPIVRTQADTIIVTHQPRSFNERELLAEQYLTAGQDTTAKRVGKQMLDEITSQQFRAMVVDTSNKAARKFSDYVFHAGPCPSPPNHVCSSFRLGTAEQWEEDKAESAKDKARNFDVSKLKKAPPKKPSSVGRHHDVREENFSLDNTFLPSVF